MKCCPLCNGTGKIGNKIEFTAKELRAKKMSIRQIAKVLGKGSTTIHYHLNKGSLWHCVDCGREVEPFQAQCSDCRLQL